MPERLIAPTGAFGEREPNCIAAKSTLATETMLRLVTIPISHYCEKARWALERAGLAYKEERHVQGIHQVAARRAGGGITVPVLVTPSGAIGESAEILEWVDERTPQEFRLFPAEPNSKEEVVRLCRRFDEMLGPTGRRLMYVHMLAARELALRFNNEGVPGWEDRAIRFGWPFAKGFVGRALGIRPGIEIEDEAAVWRELDFVADLLSDGRPYLCGGSFNAADLTFAALAGSIVVPPEYGVPLPQPAILPARMAALVERAREHPAGRYALALFTRHRRRRVAAPDTSLAVGLAAPGVGRAAPGVGLAASDVGLAAPDVDRRRPNGARKA